MKTVTPYRYYKLGSGLRFLNDAQQGWAIKGDNKVYFNLKTLIALIDELQLPVSACALGNLHKLEEKFRNEPENARLSLEHQKELRAAAKAFREVVSAELLSLIVYTIVPKRFPSDKLYSNVGSLLSAGVFERLPTIAQQDLDEAGKCIVFERPTAAAFHLLRATEASLKDFYLSAIKQKRVRQLMMGPIIIDMRIKRKTMHLRDLIACLDNIRSSYRNPTQHPEMMYDLDQVQDLLAVCFDAITKISRAKAAL